VGDGERDAFENDDRRPLPREDRIWRHPSEVAAEIRQLATARRRRRQRAGASLLGGLAAASGLIWLSENGGTDVSITADIVAIGSNDDGSTAVSSPTTTLPATIAALDGFTDEDLIVIRSAESAELLAGALVARDGYVITSGRALAGATHVMISFGDRQESGTVVGYDEVTDVTVIRLDDNLTPDALAMQKKTDGAKVDQGDLVTIAEPGGSDRQQRVVSAASSSALDDGAPVVGVVELDGRIGQIPPGSPAYDSEGEIVGMTSSTAADAPAALVPIRLVREVADELIDEGVASHPWIGLAARNGDEAGSIVTAVTEDGPAANGGIEEGDLIIEIDSTSIASMEEMVATLREHEPGDALTIVVIRDGEHVDCSVELALHSNAA
jgi:putative serine protease PepD